MERTAINNMSGQLFPSSLDSFVTLFSKALHQLPFKDEILFDCFILGSAFQKESNINFNGALEKFQSVLKSGVLRFLGSNLAKLVMTNFAHLYLSKGRF